MFLVCIEYERIFWRRPLANYEFECRECWARICRFPFAASEGVVRFTVGQPDFRTPQPVVDSAVIALEAGMHGYTRSQGTESACKSVAEHLSKYGIDVDHNDVVISRGCKQALLYAMMTCLNPGDEVILLSPAWPSYEGMLSLIGAVPVNVPVNRHNYHPDMDAIRSAITPKTKAIMVNSPNNQQVLFTYQAR